MPTPVWTPDTTLRPGAALGAWEADTGLFGATLAGWRTGKPMAVFRVGGARLGLGGDSTVWEMADGSVLPWTSPAAANEQQPVGNRLFALGGLGSGIDDEYRVDDGRLKHNWILPANVAVPDGARRLVFRFNAFPFQCAFPTPTGRTVGSIPLYAPSGGTVLSVVRGDAVDEAGNKTHVTYDWQTVGPLGKVSLTVSVDADWLRAAVGRVTVDPTVVASGQTTTGRRIVTLSTGRQVSFVRAATGYACYVSDDRGASPWTLCTSPASGIVTAQTGALVADVDADDTIHILTSHGTYTTPGALKYAQVKVTGLAATVVETQVEAAGAANFLWNASSIIAKGAAGGDKRVYLGYSQTAFNFTGNELWRRRVATVTVAGVYTSFWNNTYTSDNGTFVRNDGISGTMCRLANGDVWDIFSNGKDDATKSFLRVSKRVGETDFATVYTLDNGTASFYPPRRFVGVDGFTKPYWVASSRASPAGYCGLYDDVGEVISNLGTTTGMDVAKPLTAVGDPAKNRIIIVGVSATAPNYLRRAIVDLATKTVTSAVDIDATISLTAAGSAVGGARALAGVYYPVLFTNGTNTYSHTLAFNQAPSMPTNLTRSNFDATAAAVFRWTFNDLDPGDAPSAYRLQILRVTDLVVVVDTNKVVSGASQHTLAAGALVNGTNYQWRVMTWDQSDAAGAWSDYATFTASTAPTATINSPAQGSIHPGGLLTGVWTTNDPAGTGQSKYRLRLYNSNRSVTIEDTLEIADVATRRRTLTTQPSNNTDYQVGLMVANGNGIWSSEVYTGFNVSFTAPAFPVPTVIPNPDQYPPYTEIRVLNPDNLFTKNQSDVETDLTGIALNQGGTTAALVRDTTEHHQGIASAKLTHGNGYSFCELSSVPAPAGKQCTFSCWVKVIGQTTIHTIVRPNVAPSYIDATHTVTAGDWTRIVQTLTVPAGATVLQISIGWEAVEAPAGRVVYVDESRFKVGVDDGVSAVGGGPIVTGNTILRRIKDSAGPWTSLGTCPVNGSLRDYSGASDVMYDYRVAAVGDNQTEANSTPVVGGISRDCWWFVPINDPSQAIPFAFNREAGGQDDTAFQEIETMGPDTVHAVGGKQRDVLHITATYVDSGDASPHAGVSLSKVQWLERFKSLKFIKGWLHNPEGKVWRGILEPPQWTYNRDMVVNATTIQATFKEKRG